MPAWKKAGNPLVSEPASLKDLMDKDMSFVLVDLRETKDAATGFIQGAVTLPMKELSASKDKFPADLSAPVILYSDKNTEEAFKIVRGWGYKETSMLNGGIDSWKKAGNKLSTGNLETKIAYTPKPRPGEISIEEFKSIAEKGASDKLILDVREEDEAMHGMLKGAINIPGEKLAERIKELPKDKEIITHCATGIRAESAYDILKTNGIKARFLNAVIQIDKDGKYEITKK
jgi:rhodanese-related sulfurtransferase